jgi:hypothetical protein
MKKEKSAARSQKPEGEKRAFGRCRVFALSSGFWLLASGFFLGLFLTGCSSSSRESSDARSEKTLRDPMGYSPQFEKTDVSGGGLLDYDKDGMRKDLKNVLDP